MIVLKSENKIDLERKIRVIDKLINEFTNKNVCGLKMKP